MEKSGQQLNKTQLTGRGVLITKLEYIEQVKWDSEMVVDILFGDERFWTWWNIPYLFTLIDYASAFYQHTALLIENSEQEQYLKSAVDLCQLVYILFPDERAFLMGVERVGDGYCDSQILSCRLQTGGVLTSMTAKQPPVLHPQLFRKLKHLI